MFSLHFRVLDGAPPELLLRIEMVLFSTVGLALLSAAVWELAGPRPARIAAWILALEPANIFFSSLIHKEPLMYLAEGLVVFGGAVLWKRGKLTALIPMVVGCLLAMATRPVRRLVPDRRRGGGRAARLAHAAAWPALARPH